MLRDHDPRYKVMPMKDLTSLTRSDPKLRLGVNFP